MSEYSNFLINLKEIFKTLNEKIPIFFSRLNSIMETISKIDFDAIPQKLQEEGEKWGVYGWVPILPTFDGSQCMEMSIAPDSKEEADKLMLSYLDDDSINQLFNEIRDYLIANNKNITTFEEAKKCFENDLYTSCSIDICALIDGVFISFQAINNNKRRSLSKEAIKRFCTDSPDSQYSVAVIAIKFIITGFFSVGDDFKKTDTSFNRNYISHGMNIYNPNRTDCLKLLVVLYNLFLAFDSGWLQRTDIGETT